MKRVLQTFLPGIAALLFLWFVPLPAQAAVGDAAYIAASNKSLINMATIIKVNNKLKYEEYLAILLTGKKPVGFTDPKTGDLLCPMTIDDNGNLTSIGDSRNVNVPILMTYDENGYLSGTICKYNPYDFSCSPIFSEDGTLIGYVENLVNEYKICDEHTYGINFEFDYDELGRINRIVMHGEEYFRLWQTQEVTYQDDQEYDIEYNDKNEVSRMTYTVYRIGSLIGKIRYDYTYNRFGEVLKSTPTDLSHDDELTSTSTIYSYQNDGTLFAKRADYDKDYRMLYAY